MSTPPATRNASTTSGEKASAISPSHSRCNRQTSPPDAEKLNYAREERRIPAAQEPERLGKSKRCAWSQEGILRAKIAGPYDRHDLRFELDEVFHRIASGL